MTSGIQFAITSGVEFRATFVLLRMECGKRRHLIATVRMDTTCASLARWYHGFGLHYPCPNIRPSRSTFCINVADEGVVFRLMQQGKLHLNITLLHAFLMLLCTHGYHPEKFRQITRIPAHPVKGFRCAFTRATSTKH
jgi:hypothetical protein